MDEAEQLRSIEEREGELQARELRASAVEALAAKGLPPSLAGALRFESAEAMQGSLQAVETAFQKAIDEALNARLAGEAPGVNARGARMTGVEAAFYRMNPQLKGN